MIEKIQATRRAERLLEEGNTKEAIELLLDFLESYEEEQTELYNEIIQIKANFLRAKRRRSMGIIASKREDELIDGVHVDIQAFLDRMNGRIPMRQRAWWLKVPNYVYWSILSLAVLLSFFTFRVTKTKAIKKVVSHCPEFEIPTDFNILILPLNAGKGDAKSPLSEFAKAHFQLYIDSMNLAINVGTSTLSLNNERYPTDVADAVNLAKDCDAQLVLWADDRFVYYKFVDQKEQFKFYQLYPDQGEQTIALDLNVPISSTGKISKNAAPSTLNYLLGTAAGQIQDYSSAVQLLRTPLKDSSNQNLMLLRYLQLADSEMKVSNPTKAIEAYDELLKLRPQYDFVRLNRSVLALQTTKYQQALKDLDSLLNTNIKNHLAFYTKGRVLAKMEQLKEASIIFNALDSVLLMDSTQYNIDFKTTIVGKTQSDIAKKKYQTQKLLRESRQAFRDDPQNIALQNSILQYCLQLGEDEKASTILEKFKAVDSTTLEVINNRIIALEATQGEETALFWKNWMRKNASFVRAKFVNR